MSELIGYIEATKIEPKLEDITITPSKKEQNFKSKVDGYDNIRVNAIPCETLNITPKKEKQVIEGMYDKVNVDGISAEILNITPKKETQYFDGIYEKIYVDRIVGDNLNITPSMTDQSFNGLYENVNVDAIQTEEVTIDPDFSTQDTFEVTATEGKLIKKAIVNKDANLAPENILAGTNIYGLDGAYKPLDTSDATATAEDIAKDKTAYVNGEKVVGTLEVSGGSASDLNVKIDLASLVNGTNITTSMSNSTYRDYFIKKVDFTNTDLSTKPNMESLFSNSYGLTEVVGLDGNYVTNMKSLFNGCSSLEKIEIYNTQNVTTMRQMFSGCSTLKEIPELDCSSCIDIYGAFSSCSVLESFGGLKNLGKAFTQASANYSSYRVNLSQLKNLTHESLMNIINGLYDLNLTYDVANGGTLYKQTLNLSDESIALLTADEIAIATNKGWDVS